MSNLLDSFCIQFFGVFKKLLDWLKVFFSPHKKKLVPIDFVLPTYILYLIQEKYD